MISVIVPVYNTKSTLQRCVDSILAQTYTDFELILVDDGSPDGAGELCDQLARQHSRIRVLHQKNAGLSAARNAALKIAQGDYITFVDSDDAADPTLLQILLDNHRAPISICSFLEILPSGASRPLAGASSDPAPETFDTATCLRRMLLEQGFTMSACGKLYDHQLFQSVEFPEGKLYEDVGTTYRLILQCEQAIYTSAPLYHYYQNSGSIIHQGFNFHKLDLITLTDQMCDTLDAEFSELKDITNLRRMHARFSILRQMVLASPASADRLKFQQTEQEITKYLHIHKSWVLKNPHAGKRDQLAMRSLLLGLPAFKLAWQVYAKLR